MRASTILGLALGIVVMAWAFTVPTTDKPYIFVTGFAMVLVACCHDALRRAQEKEIEETGQPIDFHLG